MVRKYLGVLAVSTSACAAQAMGVPLDSPAMRVAAASALGWLVLQVVGMRERFAALEAKVGELASRGDIT